MELCGKQVPEETNLVKHILPSHKCEPCGIQFPEETDLVEHRLSCWWEGWCELCGKQFPEETDLVEHRLSCWWEGWCELCGKQFPEETDLEGHMLSYHCSPGKSDVDYEEELYTCDICDAFGLERMRHHPCKHCGKRFCGKSSLELHMTENQCDTEAEIITTINHTRSTPAEELDSKEQAMIGSSSNASEVANVDSEEELYICNFRCIATATYHGLLL
jgi:hypothetical protein